MSILSRVLFPKKYTTADRSDKYFWRKWYIPFDRVLWNNEITNVLAPFYGSQCILRYHSDNIRYSHADNSRPYGHTLGASAAAASPSPAGDAAATEAKYEMTFFVFSVFPAPDSPLDNTGTRKHDVYRGRNVMSFHMLAEWTKLFTDDDVLFTGVCCYLTIY